VTGELFSASVKGRFSVKKLIALVLIACACLTAGIGCGGGSSPTKPTQTKPST
jgi:hypothetical protein